VGEEEEEEEETEELRSTLLFNKKLPILLLSKYRHPFLLLILRKIYILPHHYLA
jgi:hypothetical protein